MSTAGSMSRLERLRRVLILCRNFAVNLAYYRVGRTSEHVGLQDFGQNPRANFWRAMSGNSIDICVLEWCKLFAETKGKHYWGNIVSDPVGFKAQLLKHLGINETEFQREIHVMRQYRDKFLAHLDSDPIMNIPALDIAKKAVWFYYAHVVQHEGIYDMAEIPTELETGYASWAGEAHKIYSHNAASGT